MKAYEIHAIEGLDALRPAERASRALQAGEVRVKVKAVSLNYRDLFVIRGAKAANRPTPIVPTSDGAGEVIEVGPGVSSLKVGDRVAAGFFPTWLDGALSDDAHANALGGGSNDGMLIEEKILPESAWIPLPEGYSYEEGATLPCAAVTAWNALFVGARFRAGDIVLVQGTGGVSLFALQLAKAAGARVIATSSSDAKIERLKALGAWKTINYKTTPEWGKAAHALTEGRGADIVVEVGGPNTFDQSVHALRYGGTMSLLGVLTGFQGPVNLYQIFHKGLHIAGIYVGSRAMFSDLNTALSTNQIKPIIDRVFPFAEARAAYDHLVSGAHFGKIVIKVG